MYNISLIVHCSLALIQSPEFAQSCEQAKELLNQHFLFVVTKSLSYTRDLTRKSQSSINLIMPSILINPSFTSAGHSVSIKASATGLVLIRALSLIHLWISNECFSVRFHAGAPAACLFLCDMSIVYIFAELRLGVMGVSLRLSGEGCHGRQCVITLPVMSRSCSNHVFDCQRALLRRFQPPPEPPFWILNKPAPSC